MLTVLLALALSANPADREEAKRFYQGGSQAYARHDFEGALVEFTKALRLDDVPSLLFNVAQCHRALGHWGQAAFFYRAYLDKKPDAANRSEVLARIDEMDAKVDKVKLTAVVERAAPAPSSGTPAPAPPPAIAAAAPSPTLTAPESNMESSALIPSTEAEQEAGPSRSHVGSLLLFGGAAVGAALGIAGAVVAANYLQEKSSIESNVNLTRYSVSTVHGDQTTASVWAGVGIAAGALAIAAIVGGVVTW